MTRQVPSSIPGCGYKDFCKKLSLTLIGERARGVSVCDVTCCYVTDYSYYPTWHPRGLYLDVTWVARRFSALSTNQHPEARSARHAPPSDWLPSELMKGTIMTILTFFLFFWQKWQWSWWFWSIILVFIPFLIKVDGKNWIFQIIGEILLAIWCLRYQKKQRKMAGKKVALLLLYSILILRYIM